MGIKQTLIFIGLCIGLLLPNLALAHQPVLESAVESSYKNDNAMAGIYLQAVKVADPTKTSLALYGRLSNPGEMDVYAFVPESSAEIPIELLVPIRPANQNFKPSVFLIAKNLSGSNVLTADQLSFAIPDGYQAMELRNEHSKGVFHEPFAQESYYRGEELKFTVEPNQNYFLAIVEPNKQTGDYSLGIGTVEDFANADFGKLSMNILSLKLGLVGNTTIPWLNIVGLFIMMAGLIIGLGAVTVIDMHGFLARRSEYWTESTIRAHKVTKPLIWLGIFLFIIGGAIVYRESWLTGVAFYQALLTLILILNGLFLTFYVSPRLLKQEKDGDISKILPQGLQNKITLSFLVSFIGWWGNVFFLVWYLLIMN